MIGIGNNITTVNLQDVTTLNFEFATTQAGQLIVELGDKQGQEAVVIEEVSFFGISDPKFAWAGIYEPVYPEPWATEQRNQGVVLKQHLSPQTYLGFNGKWTLTFSVPVFTWMHTVQNLGWIYD
jgi:hypothetical protein